MRQKLLLWSKILCVGIAISSIALAIWWVPIRQVSSFPDSLERVKAETAARDLLIKAVGGSLVFVTAFVGIRNLQATQKNILVTEEKQITERFSKAVEMLGNEGNVHIRLGGIYALERIAIDSKKDHYTVMQVLAAFARTKVAIVHKQGVDTKWRDLHYYEEFSSGRDMYESAIEAEHEERFGRYYEDYDDMYDGEYEYYIGTLNTSYVPNYLIDVQAAVSAIGRQNIGSSSSYILDLSKTLFEGITFEGNYENVSFYRAHFKDCLFGTQSEKEYASFQDNNFSEAIFEKVEFKHAIFRKARFNNAVFVSTAFEDTYFTGADLTKAQFSGGTKICECEFDETIWIESSIGNDVKVPKTERASARLAVFRERSEVRCTNFSGADFTGSKLVNTVFEQGSYQGTSFNASTLSGVTFKDADLRESSFRQTRIGDESKFYMGYKQYGSRKTYQEDYSDQVSFINAGIKLKDLEKKKAVIVEANCTY